MGIGGTVTVTFTCDMCELAVPKQMNIGLDGTVDMRMTEWPRVPCKFYVYKMQNGAGDLVVCASCMAKHG